MKGIIIKMCKYCHNARVDEELNDYNDFSSYTIGLSEMSHRVMFSAGNGKRCRIVFESYTGKFWIPIGYFEPDFCPFCGRDLRNDYVTD